MGIYLNISQSIFIFPAVSSHFIIYAAAVKIAKEFTTKKLQRLISTVPYTQAAMQNGTTYSFLARSRMERSAGFYRSPVYQSRLREAYR